MKLYTEEQVREAFDMGRWNKHERDYVVNLLTPIKLPTDDEVYDACVKELSKLPSEHIHGIIFGAKWMREHIIKQIEKKP